MNDTSVPEQLGAESLVAEVTDAYMERLRCGERPDVEDYARRYPQIAAVLRHVLPALQVIGSSAPGRSANFAESPADIEPEAPLGDYRIVREVGRGGMGVVYQAVQMSLGREVALKVLPFAAAMDPKQLQRFKNEAQAAAQLHHTNIVPVYGVGCERGVHFYAMQYIEGQTVAAIIAELRRLTGLDGDQKARPAGPAAELTENLASGRWAPASRDPAGPPGSATVTGTDSPSAGSRDVPPAGATRPAAVTSTARSIQRPAYFRTVAGLGVQAARALEHAHGLGVIHRDIKPANLIVDLRGDLWITDFGLARLHGGTELTVTGDLVGTLRYMSPEQALAHPVTVDHRTDVYSLGMTLYELVALEPAFAGRNRSELLRQIAFEEPRRPQLLNRAVPPDLETIVLKAIEKTPTERYVTAQELAEDLQRFLDDKPIKARRPTLSERARKWARRHRPVVTTGAAGLIVTMSILAGSLGWIVRDRAARSEVTDREGNRALAEAAKFQGRAKWPEALEAAKRAEGFLAVGGSERLRRRVRELRNDLEMVLHLEEIRLPDPVRGVGGFFEDQRADGSYAQAFREYGIDVESLDTTEAAQRVCATAIRLELTAALDDWARKRKGNSKPDDLSWKRLVAVARAADPDEWRDQVRAALMRLDHETLNKLAGSEKINRLPLQTLSLLGEALDSAGAGGQAVAVLRLAQQKYPDDFQINFQLAWALDHAQEPTAAVDEVIRFYTVALALHPRNVPTHVFLGYALQRHGKIDEAIALFRRGIALEPASALTHGCLGSALEARGKLDQALLEYEKSLELRPDGAMVQNQVAWLLATYPDPGHRDPRRAVELARKAVGAAPKKGMYWNTLGVAQYRAGDWGGAISALQKSIALQGHNSYDWFFMAMARWQLGERPEADRLYDQAVDWMRKYKPNDEELRRFRAEAAMLLGIADPIPSAKGKTAR